MTKFGIDGQLVPRLRGVPLVYSRIGEGSEMPQGAAMSPVKTVTACLRAEVQGATLRNAVVGYITATAYTVKFNALRENAINDDTEDGCSQLKALRTIGAHVSQTLGFSLECLMNRQTFILFMVGPPIRFFRGTKVVLHGPHTMQICLPRCFKTLFRTSLQLDGISCPKSSWTDSWHGRQSVTKSFTEVSQMFSGYLTW